MDWLELAIIAFIMATLGLSIFKGGRANPQSTGTLGKTVNGLSTQVGRLDGRLGHVESELEELADEAATTKDIARLEEKLSTVRAEMNGHRELAKLTWKSVDRIERMLIEKGLSSS